MKNTKLMTAVATVLASGMVMATPPMQRPSGSTFDATSFSVEAGIGASSGALSGASVGVTGAENSVTSVSAFGSNTSFTATTIGFGKTKGKTGTLGGDYTSAENGAAGSVGLTGGKGGAKGISVTSVSGSTSDAGVTGYNESEPGYVQIEPTPAYTGGAFGVGGAESGVSVEIEYTDKSIEFTRYKRPIHNHGSGNHSAGNGQGHDDD